MSDIIKTLFNTRLPAALARNAEDARTIGAKFQLQISGPNGGDWYIDVSGTPTAPQCVSGPGPGNADCTISVSDDDFEKLLADPQIMAMQMYFNGKLQVAGNQMLALKLQKLFSYQ
ncbi:MAG TPA: SCP2 sterol-binding domain-containing protein [Kofleriaceae bacterium]|nr:SCP2 sterol-binding domain-containing protein [Kofleriaceae bacterium]